MKVELSWSSAALMCLMTMLQGQPLVGQESGVLGYWREPHGSVIQVESCGAEICATLVEISPTAPARVDGKNPDPKLRQRSLCGLRIGEGFHLTSPARAEGGSLYDPESGRTYKAVMSSNGDQMDLRGYVGLPVFGRTERWKRTSAVTACRV